MTAVDIQRFPTSPIDGDQFDLLVRKLQALLGRQDAIEDIYPLSPVQEAMLFHTVAADADDLYVIQQRLAIDGALDVDVLRRAWADVVARHPALRTCFAWQHPGRPAQIVCRGIEVGIDVHDLSDDAEPSSTIDRWAEADRRQRFRLDEPPLMRITVFRLSHDRHEMVWSQHHLVEDGWSASTVLREVFTAYEAIAHGRDPEFAPVPPFRDYITWLESRDADAMEGFWREYLAGFRQPTRMADRRAERRAGEYARLTGSLSPELTSALRQLARRARLTLNTVVVGALAIVLSRHLGHPDVAFGTVSSGRPPVLPGVESMVGMFINTLILRVEVEPDRPLLEWLIDVQARQASLFDHEHAPLTTVQAWSELDPGMNLTDVLFAYWGFDAAGASPDGTLTYRTVGSAGRNSFPFSVTVEAADPLSIGLAIDETAVDATTAERFMEHLGALLGAMVATPDATVGALSMVTDEELAGLTKVNETAMTWPHATVLDAFASQCLQTPDAVAVEFGNREVTYSELDQHSDQIAGRISALGEVNPRVAVYLPRSPDLLASILGVLKAGGAFVPIDRHQPPQRVQSLIADSGSAIVITNGSLRERLDLGEDVAVLAASDSEHDAGPSGSGPVPGDLAYVMYTSGSTGRPKGVMVTHGSLANYVSWASAEYGGGQPICFPLFTSPGFDLTITSMFVPLVSGGSVVVYPDDDLQDLSVLDVFEEDRVDIVKLTPSHLALLETHHLSTERIRGLVVGGEDLKTSLARSVTEHSGGRLVVYNEYGPTEATVGCMIHRYDPETDQAGSVPIGRPIANARIHLLDDEGRHVPLGVVGEIWIGGAGVARGYLGEPELTDERFVAEPFGSTGLMYRSGDRGRWLRPGVMAFLRRTDEQVQVRGYRIEPAEIELALTEHDSVANAAVAIREPRPGDQRLVAYYVAVPGTFPNVTDLRRHLRERLPEYMVTRNLVRVDSVPLTPNGKLDRAALPNTVMEAVSVAEYVAPRTPAEQLLTDLSSELLGVERVSIRDNFFELGGHSVLAMQLIASIHARTGERISPRVILLNTLEQAAALIPPETLAPRSVPVGDLPGSDGAPARSVGTSAFFFGPSEEPLFGMLHSPSVASRSRGVLLCPPLGWEFMRTHWALRRVARLSALAGSHVLRFDYYGTGDSAGTAADGSVGRWVSDVAVAATELRDSTGSDELVVVGVRLGATLAALAVHDGLPADELVLWDPVVRGDAYLRALDRMQTEMLAARGNRNVAPALAGDELLGFPYPPSRRREIEEVDLTRLSWAGITSTVVASQDRPEYRLLVEAPGSSMRYDVVPDAGTWDDLASSQATLLPSAIPAHIARTLGGAT